MAKPTKKKTPGKSAPAKKAVAKAVAPRPAAASSDDVAPLFAGLPELTDDDRNAFHSEHDETACIAMGGQTRSGAVRDLALTWISETKKAALANLIDLDASRVRWMVELLALLDAQRAAAAGANTAQTTLRTTRDVAAGQVKRLRTRLSSKLTLIARNTSFAAGVQDQRSDGGTDSARRASLGALADIADKLLASRDTNIVARCRARKLTAADVEAARAAITALSGARGDVALGTPSAVGKDPPAVNAVEGRLLFELIDARDAIDTAIEDGAAVSPLVPSSATAHVLARAHKKKPAAPGPSQVAARPG